MHSSKVLGRPILQRISIILISVVTSAAYSQPTATVPTPAASPSDRAPTKPQLTLTWHLADHVRESYSGWNSLAHIGAVGATYLLIESGVDADVHAWSARRNETLSIAASVPALIGGFFVPVAVPLYIMRSDATRNGGMAAQQAVFVSFTVTTLLKALTGRSPPDAETPRDVDKRSRHFRYGFLRGGIIHGWPSGHTMTNMALAASLSSYFNDSKRVKYYAYGWAAYVMAAATFGAQGGVHWLSDVVAGGLMGWTIGTTIGKGFAQGSLQPLAAPDRWGLQLTLNAD